MNKIAVIDDDVELVDMMKEYLQQEGFDVTAGHDGLTAEQYVLTSQFDLMILDVMMPVQDGIQTLRNIRVNSTIPVIMLTAKGDNLDRITGLELGADDYVAKPCTPRELVARVRAILRRIQSKASRTYEITVGDLTIWSSQRRAEWQKQLLSLTSTEFNLLETLARHAGAIVTKEELSQQALGRPLAKFDRSIDVHLSSIRQKIAQLSGNPNVIQTVYRMGYQLVKE